MILGRQKHPLKQPPPQTLDQRMWLSVLVHEEMHYFIPFKMNNK